METTAQPQIRRALDGREPALADYWLFFVGIPAAIAVLFSMVGVRLIMGLPYLVGLGYMLLHMFTAWWSVSLGSWLVRYAFRSWRPPVIAICVMGFFVSLVPAGFLFQRLGEFYGGLYPIFAANRADSVLPSWGIDYLLHFIRYSFPALPLFLAGVYGYRYVRGVDWLGYGVTDTATAARAPGPDTARKTTATLRPMAGLIDGSKLPGDAELIAIKAEQHYIRIWSDRGTDMVRYRFRDLAEVLGGCDAGQVHRSWWVNFDRVRSRRLRGRKLELELDGDLRVPVSTSFKRAVIDRLDG